MCLLTISQTLYHVNYHRFTVDESAVLQTWHTEAENANYSYLQKQRVTNCFLLCVVLRRSYRETAQLFQLFVNTYCVRVNPLSGKNIC